jgi:hypothetical protein
VKDDWDDALAELVKAANFTEVVKPTRWKRALDD